jgi:hypothetical protein
MVERFLTAIENMSMQIHSIGAQLIDIRVLNDLVLGIESEAVEVKIK